jgi:hypothetical protein
MIIKDGSGQGLLNQGKRMPITNLCRVPITYICSGWMGRRRCPLRRLRNIMIDTGARSIYAGEAEFPLK